MKAFFSCLMLVTFLASQVLAGNVFNIKVPEKIIKSFQMKYPKHTDANWDDLGDLFVVTFHDGAEKEATFDLDGNWIETITNLEEEELPQTITIYIEKKYGEDVEFYEFFFSEKPKGNFYFVNIGIMQESDDEDEESENQSYTLTFDENGKFLNQE